MLLELAVRTSQALNTDITDINPDAGVIGSDNIAKVNGVVALVWWVASALLVIWLVVGIVGFSSARKNNPAKAEAAKSNLTNSIIALVLYGGLSTIVKITTGLLG